MFRKIFKPLEKCRIVSDTYKTCTYAARKLETESLRNRALPNRIDTVRASLTNAQLGRSATPETILQGHNRPRSKSG